jgi:hypothetical protein
MQKLTTWTKLMLTVIAVGSTFGAVHTYGKGSPRPVTARPQPPAPAKSAPAKPRTAASGNARPPAPAARLPNHPLRVALSQWPGHMALLVGAGGLKTQPGSLAAAEQLNLEIVFIEDAPSKNEALRKGDVDFVWQTVDE